MQRQRATLIAIVLLSAVRYLSADLATFEQLNTGSANVLYSPSSTYSDEEIDFALDRSGFYQNWNLPTYSEEPLLDLSWRSSEWPVGYGRSNTTLSQPASGRSRTLFIRQEFVVPDGPDTPVLINLPSPSSGTPTYFNLSGTLHLDGEERYRSDCCQDANQEIVANPGFLDVARRDAEDAETFFLGTLSPGRHTLAVSSHPFGSTSQVHRANVVLSRPVNTKIWSGDPAANWSDNGSWHFGKPNPFEVAAFMGERGALVTIDQDTFVSGFSFHSNLSRTLSGRGTITFESTNDLAHIDSNTNRHVAIQNDLLLNSPLEISAWGSAELSGLISTNGNPIRIAQGSLFLTGDATGEGTLRIDGHSRVVNNGLFVGAVSVNSDAHSAFENNGEVIGSITLSSDADFLHDGLVQGDVFSTAASLRGSGTIVGNVDLGSNSMFTGNIVVSGEVAAIGSLIDPGDITNERDFLRQNAGEITVGSNVRGAVEIDLFRPQVFDSLQGDGGSLFLESLRIDAPMSFQPPNGTEFSILKDWGTIQVNDLQLPPIEQGSWDTSLLLTDGVIVFRNDEGPSSPFGCDFDQNSVCDITDLDALTDHVFEVVNDLTFDMNKDRVVDNQDVDEWLVVAALRNGFASAYLYGDSNLDGRVNAADLMNIGINWQQRRDAGWDVSDFNSDGRTDAKDLNFVALNWQAVVPMTDENLAANVPEPANALLLLLGTAGLFSILRRSRNVVIVLLFATGFGLYFMNHSNATESARVCVRARIVVVGGTPLGPSISTTTSYDAFDVV